MSSNSNEDLHSSINPSEVEKFGHFWPTIKNGDPETHGLNQMNEIRVPFIAEGLIGKNKLNQSNCLQDFSILEVGCGAGFFTAGLAKQGAKVTGLDPSSAAVETAKWLLNTENNQHIAHRVTLVCSTIEEYAVNNKNRFDAVVLSEVLEHVSDRSNFLKVCITTVKPGGSVFITTFEKNFLTWITAIVLMETVFKILPRGFHDWNEFVPISDLAETFADNKCSIISTQGFWFNFFSHKFQLIGSTKISSYALHAVKRL